MSFDVKELWEGLLEQPAMTWGVLVCLVGLALLAFLLARTKWTARMLAAGALCVAMAFILDCITLFRMPQGGGIKPAAMLPILFFAWTFGPLPGIAAGTVHGLLGLIAGAYIIHPLQFLLDYIFPYAVLGLAGLFQGEKHLPWGILLACAVRFLMHFLSGWLFFGSYAPAGQGPALYSFLYNGSFMLPNTLLCLVIVLLPPLRRMLLRLRCRLQAGQRV